MFQPFHIEFFFIWFIYHRTFFLCMKHNSIFWLEDDPAMILPALERDGKYLYFDSREFLKRTTLAYDFNSGRDLIMKKDYSLYILDGDFPDTSRTSDKEFIDDYVGRFKEGKAKEDEWIERIYPDDKPYNFVPFYLEHLDKMRGKTVVYSMNDGALILSFHLGLPGFDKSKIGPEEKRKFVLKNTRLMSPTACKLFPSGYKLRDVSLLRSWECGGTKELIKNYLL